MVALAATFAIPAEASAARYDSRTLSSGMHGADVKQLQRYLTGAGHRVTADGQFGPRTARALRAAERGLELRVDGIATRRDQRLIRRAVKTPAGGGAVYVKPPAPTKTVPGQKGTVTADGFAVPPSSAPAAVKSAIAAGNEIAKTPYKWGGGHGSWTDSGYDCSGSVSYALHAAGLLDSPLVSGGFSNWGDPGTGKWITLYSNAGHVYMVIAGLRFDTSAQSRTGSRWTTEARSPSGFKVTHPAGL
jgi:cell wall-associated NlpC family hydrolase